mmetsp:Transcript_21514/g.38861  ORF Transcript_21514/g.38861 Transcript_21514/m.38861 type:complete len:101 (-) Transcript_21514:452-754(-)
MSAAKLDDLEEDTLLEALSHFDLIELAEVRKVSPTQSSKGVRSSQGIHPQPFEEARRIRRNCRPIIRKRKANEQSTSGGGEWWCDNHQWSISDQNPTPHW